MKKLHILMGNCRMHFQRRQSRKIIFLLITFAFSIMQSYSQQLPVVKVRFTNPNYDCTTHLYCLDVEFQSDTEGKQVFGVNVRLFYDDYLLEYISMGDFAEGYGISEPYEILTGPSGSGAFFGLSGPIEWFNGSVRLIGPSSVYISTTGWTKLFNICFLVEDLSYIYSHPYFCPPIIWDLQEDPSNGGYNSGDDGLVITLVAPPPNQSSPTTENVEQFNWQYESTPNSFGYPVEIVCIQPACFVIPIANWAIFLAIGLMIFTSALIYRRRVV